MANKRIHLHVIITIHSFDEILTSCWISHKAFIRLGTRQDIKIIRLNFKINLMLNVFANLTVDNNLFIVELEEITFKCTQDLNGTQDKWEIRSQNCY